MTMTMTMTMLILSTSTMTCANAMDYVAYFIVALFSIALCMMALMFMRQWLLMLIPCVATVRLWSRMMWTLNDWFVCVWLLLIIIFGWLIVWWPEKIQKFWFRFDRMPCPIRNDAQHYQHNRCRQKWWLTARTRKSTQFHFIWFANE